MSKSVKLINEGFSRKYMKEDLQAALEKDIKNALKAKGYNVDVEGADNYIQAAAEYIDMSNEFGDSYSVEEWLKDTEMNYPEDLAFMKESCEECIQEDVEVKEIFHNDNGEDYEVIERSASGKNALLNKGKQWIVAWNCPQDSGSWGQGHYFFDEVEARKVWEDKYLNESFNEALDDNGKDRLKRLTYNALSDVMYEIGSDADKNDLKEAVEFFFKKFFKESFNESLEENDSFDFISDIYNALSDVMFKYKDKGVDKSDMDNALGWFDIHFWETDFEEKLQECITKLNEAEMSDEDKADSELLWNIYNKTKQRANAKLTPEEKAVLDKYNLVRDTGYKDIRSKDPDGKPWNGAPLISDKIGQQVNGGGWRRPKSNQSDVNLADRARKMNDRGKGYGYSSTLRDPWYDAPRTDDHREFKKPGDKYYTRLKDKGLLDRERRSQDAEMTAPVVTMKNALHDRKYHGTEVAKNDAKYDKQKADIEAEYQKKLADNEKSRKWSGKYHQDQLDRSSATIDKLLRRDKKEDQ